MTDAPQEVVARVNSLAETRFQLALEQKDVDDDFKAKEARLKAAYEVERDRIQAEIDKVDAEIWKTVESERSRLIARGKKSFVTIAAKFQLKAVSASINVEDSAAVMKVARRFGVIKHIAEPPTRKWKFNIKKFRAWLDKEPQMKPLFEEYLEETEAGETLTLQPNGTYTVVHDSKRISPPSVSIKKKSSSPA